MIRKPISTPIRMLLGVASILLVIGAYSWLSHRQKQVNPTDTTIPNAKQFADGWQKVTKKGLKEPKTWVEKIHQFRWLPEDIIVTYGRLLKGLFVGIVLSLFFGIAMGCLTPVESFCLPVLSFFAKIPPTAMLAVYFVLFGTGSNFYVAMIALGIFPTLAQSIYQSAKKDVSDHLVNKAFTLGASNMEVVWNVIFQQVLPRIIESIRLQIGPAMVFLIAAEYAVGGEGFGYRLKIQSRILNMNVVYIYLIVLGVSGFLFDWILSFTRRRLCPWFGE
ncbi:MAG: ABC transporter permease subunit [Planctomycetota bacterium]